MSDETTPTTPTTPTAPPRRRGLTFPAAPLGGKGTPPMTGLQDLTAEEQALAKAAPPAPPTPETDARASKESASTTAPEAAPNNLRTSAQQNSETSAQVSSRTNPDVHKTESALVHNQTSAQVHDAPEDVSEPGEVDALLVEILAMSKTPLVHNSSRAPEDLVAELQGHIGKNWKKRIDKQKLMSRALMLLVHELKTGKPLVVFGNESEVGLGTISGNGSE